MINAIGANGLAHAVDALRGDRVKAGAAATKVASSVSEGAASAATPAAALAAQGAPIESAKVEAIRAKIASGTFRIDPKAIADKMIATDLPGIK